jgi:hypothetical protein
MFLFSVAFGVRADENTNVGANSAAGATAVTTFAPITKSDSPVFMPNGAPSVMPNPNTFIKGTGLAEQSNAWSKMFVDYCKVSVPADAVNSERAKIILEENDLVSMQFVPYRDYYKKIPSEQTLVTEFGPEITNVFKDFGEMSPDTTHYCIGHVALRTAFDEDIQDITVQEALILEGLKFASKHITGFANVTPVILFETNAYYDGTAVKGTGISVTPQVSGIPAIGVAAGSLFSWGRNHGMASSSSGLGMKIIFLAQPPNPSEGHTIAANIQKYYAEYMARKAPLTAPQQPTPEQQQREYMKGVDSNGGERG